VLPGVQVPVHAPLTQAWLEHAFAVPQVPSEAHDWTPLPEHWVWPDAQLPVHAPFLQVAVLPHGLAVLHPPLGLHVWTPLSAEH